MRKILLGILVVFGVLANPVFAVSVDPCIGANVKHNSWLLEINSENYSSREGLLKTLDLLSTGGFALKQIFSNEVLSSKTLVVSFNPSYYLEEDKAMLVKDKTLGELKSVEGNVIHCNGIFRPVDR